MDTILANARFFEGDLAKVPTMALTVGVGTVMDAREVRVQGSIGLHCGVGLVFWLLKNFNCAVPPEYICIKNEDIINKDKIPTDPLWRAPLLLV